MHTRLPLKNTPYMSNNARRVGIVLPRTRNPRIRVDNMFLAIGMGKAEEPSWKNGDDVFFVVDVHKVWDVVVHPVCERWITCLVMRVVELAFRCNRGGKGCDVLWADHT